MRYFVPGANVSERSELPPPTAVSTVIFGLKDAEIWLPLVRRIREPFLGDWALPGGPVTWEESLTDVAERTLEQTVGFRPEYLEQLYTFGETDRTVANRIISIVYWAVVDAKPGTVLAGAENVAWFPVSGLPALAFDHARIIEYAQWRLRNKVEYAEVAHHLIGDEFTLSQLRQVYEAVLGERMDAANFRRQMLGSELLEPTGERRSNGAHRPAMVYRYRGAPRNASAPSSEA